MKKRFQLSLLATTLLLIAGTAQAKVTGLPDFTELVEDAGPAVVDGQIVVRDFLSLTIGLDHDIIDGAPGARFVNRFKGLIESAYGLPGSPITP